MKGVEMKLQFFLTVLVSLALAIPLTTCSVSSPTSVASQPTSTSIPPTVTQPSPTTLPTASPTVTFELNPSPRGYVSMAYDSESKQIIMFGGQTGEFGDSANFSDETWAYDVVAQTWANMKPAVSPQAGAAGSLAYDVESDRVILYGNTRVLSVSGETWAYDFNSNTWTKMKAKGPLGHLGLRTAYDVESDRIILFGGYSINRDEMYQDTWAFDFNSDSWVEMKPAARPPGQNFHSMTYHVKADRVLLWGGDTETGSSRPPKDPSIWVYDYNTNTWEQKLTNNGPNARAYGAMAYDTSSDEIVLYGGYTIGSNEMWAYNYDANTWTKLESSVDPGKLSRHAFVYVPDIDRFILFGGQLGNEEFTYGQSTWIYDLNANTWMDRTRHH
jgi:N-acetylneuraminic acid mutarotase